MRGLLILGIQRKIIKYADFFKDRGNYIILVYSVLISVDTQRTSEFNCLIIISYNGMVDRLPSSHGLYTQKQGFIPSPRHMRPILSTTSS